VSFVLIFASIPFSQIELQDTCWSNSFWFTMYNRQTGPDKPLGKPGKFPQPRTFGGLALEYQNTPLVAFGIFRLFTTRQIVEIFDYCVWYIGQGNW